MKCLSFHSVVVGIGLGVDVGLFSVITAHKGTNLSELSPANI